MIDILLENMITNYTHKYCRRNLVHNFSGIHTIRDITIRDMIIDLRIDIIVLNLSYFMLCDDCQIATYVYILWDYL